LAYLLRRESRIYRKIRCRCILHSRPNQYSIKKYVRCGL